MLKFILGIFGPVLSYLATRLVDKLIDGEQAKAKDLKDRELMLNLKTAAVRAVRKIELSFVQPLKDQGKWEDSRWPEARQLAIQALKASYGPEGVLNLSMFFNVNADALDKLLTGLIETAIFNDKQTGYRPGSIRLNNDDSKAHIQKDTLLNQKT